MSDHPSADVEGVFNRPFTEQVAFFRRKLGNLVPTQRWDDLEREAHDDAFMVAGAAKADLLADLAASVDKAITEGRGIEEFRRDFRAIVARNGWTGWTGEGSVKGEAWRAGVIYRTNAYTSYAAGRYAQLQEGHFPLWVYRHGNSKEPRIEHLSWDGLVLPPDHRFWATHYPPSDWGCSCYALGARSAAGAKRLGGDPGKKLPPGWDRIDPKTGAPVGIGRNWDYAPGASVSAQVNALAGKVRHWSYAIGKAFMEALPAGRADALSQAYRALRSTADGVRRYAQRIYDPKPDLPPPDPVRTLGRLPSTSSAAIDELTGANVAGYDFSVDPSAIGHIQTEHGTGSEGDRGQRPVTPADFALLPALLNAPGRIEGAGTSWRTGLPLVRYVWSRDGEEWQAVFEVRKGRRTLALTSLFVRKARRP